MTYLDAIGAHATSRPGAVALVDADGEVTYGELRRETHRMAGLLRDAGVRAGDVVACWLPNSRHWASTFLGASSLGAATLAVNTSFNAHEVSTLLGRSRARVLVMGTRHRDRDLLEVVRTMDVTGLDTVTTVLVADAPAADLAGFAADLDRVVLPLGTAASAPETEDTAALPGRPAIIFTSSGTTGEPKLVVHTQYALSGHVACVADAYRMREPDSVVMAPMPFCGVMGLETMLSALVAGTTVTTLPSFDAEGAVDQIERYAVTTFATSDEALRRIMACAGPGQLTSLRDVALAVFGGDAVELVRQAGSRGFRAFQTYGSSEVHALLCYPPAGVPEEELTLGGGRPVSPSYRVRAVDDIGRLEILSPFLFAGYLRDGDLVRPLTTDGYFRTGDLGYTTAHGFVYLTRESDALRLGGFLVEPREIESFVEAQPGVTAAQVVGVEHGGRTTAVAFVVGDDSFDEDRLLDTCRAELATFKVPARVVRLPEFPTTAGPNGVKIRRVDLRDHAARLLEATS